MATNNRLDFESLKQLVDNGTIDTVLVCLIDMQGRLMGKRFHAAMFVESGYEETHCCNYLLATDLEMGTPEGYASTSWRSGYGDYVLKPDLDTLRLVPWLEGTAMVLGDILDHHTHKPVPHSPRQMLKHQIERLSALGYSATMATELEFFLFEHSYETYARDGHKNLTPISAYNEDYHILQTTKEEHIMRPVRNHLFAMGIPVEGSKGEAEAGQEELNIRYADALACADHHSIAKHAIKEIAWQQGHAATFLSKWSEAKVGSSSHVHQSLWKDNESAFLDSDKELGMSDTMRSYLAGLIKHASEYTYFMAPYINSYKRFAKGTFAPTKIVWSVDNRTAAFRLCAENSKAIRIECRVPGSDINPYLVQAAMLAAGIKGIEDKLELSAPFVGDVYEADDEPNIPSTLLEAKVALASSQMLREAMGEDVVDHYQRCAEVEIEEFEQVVTDWEIRRGFERA
ncbi:MAG: glutamine synthetase family protein [Granulosicoccus sp.]